MGKLLHRWEDVSFIASCLSLVASCFFYGSDYRADAWRNSSHRDPHQPYKIHAHRYTHTHKLDFNLPRRAKSHHQDSQDMMGWEEVFRISSICQVCCRTLSVPDVMMCLSRSPADLEPFPLLHCVGDPLTSTQPVQTGAVRVPV